MSEPRPIAIGPSTVRLVVDAEDEFVARADTILASAAADPLAAPADDPPRPHAADGPIHAHARRADGRDARRARRDVVRHTTTRCGASSQSRLESRAPETLRPHPGYQALWGPIANARIQRIARQTGPIREPLVTTADGTILDGHARWQVALDRQQRGVLCLVYDVSADEALQFVIRQHRMSEGLNAFCRIVLALDLEPSFRERHRRAQPSRAASEPSSNLTNDQSREVRDAIAAEAGVSAGNVTKVKHILANAVPEVREQLVRGELSIHRAWQWRTLTPKAQLDALWVHFNRGAAKKTIGRLIRAHVTAQQPAQPDDVAAIVLRGLTRYGPAELIVGVVDAPGRAVVVTRACYDELREQR